MAGELNGEPLTELDLLTYCKFLLVAGTETTRNLISSGTELLSEHPDQRRLLIDAPELLPDAVEEMLRITSPVLAFCRTARADTQIRGQQIAAGDYVAMLYASANRDEGIWPDPDRFDVLRRQERPHVAFGFGPHVCLGASLARMEARVLFEELLHVYPDFQVTGPAVRGESTLVAIVERCQPFSEPGRRPGRESDMVTTGQGAGLAGGETAVREITVRGPAFEDLSPGQVFDTCPPVTLTDGLAAAHQAIVGERSWLALSRPLAAAVLGGGPWRLPRWYGSCPSASPPSPPSRSSRTCTTGVWCCTASRASATRLRP